MSKSNIDNLNDIQIKAADTMKYKDYNPLLTLNMNKIYLKDRKK